MNAAPTIRVTLVTYNHAPYVRQCLDSLLAQTLPPWRIAVFDDGSTDGTAAIIREYATLHGELFELHLQPKNLGIYAHTLYYDRHLNVGDYLCHIEGDDWWDARKLEEEYKALCRNPQAVVAYSNVAATHADGAVKFLWHESEAGPMPEGRLLFPILMGSMLSACANPCRNYLVRLSEFDPKADWYRVDNLFSLGDLHRLIGLARRFEFATTEILDPLVYYRQHENGISQDRTAVTRANVNIYQRHDADITALPPEQELAVRVRWEAGIAQSRAKLPTDDAEYYRPGCVLDRLRDRFMQLPPDLRQEVWTLSAYSIRTLTADYVMELINAGQPDPGLSLWEAHLKSDPQPFEARLAFPPEIYTEFHREQARRRANNPVLDAAVRQRTEALEAPMREHLRAGQVDEGITLWLTTLTSEVLGTLQAAFALPPELYTQLYRAAESIRSRVLRGIMYARPLVFDMMERGRQRRSA
jgi:glycosyltransferase involved in cell wall biosynthesis